MTKQAINKLNKTFCDMKAEKERNYSKHGISFTDPENFTDPDFVFDVNAEGEYIYHKEWDDGTRNTLFINHKAALFQLQPCGTRSARTIWERNKVLRDLFNYFVDNGDLKNYNN